MTSFEELKQYFQSDAMVKLLGIEICNVEPGYAETKLELKSEHMNSANMTHGAVLFAMADVTMALACNIYGKIAVAFSVTINFLRMSHTGDIIKAVAKEDSLTNRTGVYRIEIFNQNDEMLAVAEGTLQRIGN